jgi:membrane protein involved in colicin uptake
LEGCQSARETVRDEFRDEFSRIEVLPPAGILAAMGDSERRKRKLRERQAKERQRQEQRRVKAADARAQERAEEQKLLEEDRKLIEAHRPSEAEYEAKLVLLRSTKPADRESFFDDLLDHHRV